MKANLIRRTNRHHDALGNSRMVTHIIVEYNTACSEYEFTSLKEYKGWLRRVLNAYELSMKSIHKIKIPINDIHAQASYKSFYSLVKSPYGGWHVMMIVPFPNDAAYAWYLDEHESTIQEALGYVRKNSNSHDFEIHTDDGKTKEVFPLTDESMIIACLKYS